MYESWFQQFVFGTVTKYISNDRTNLDKHFYVNPNTYEAVRCLTMIAEYILITYYISN